MDQLNPDQAELEKKEKKKTKQDFSYERLRLALERLQLAWLRAAITFVALGFTAYRYYLSRVADGLEPLVGGFNGRNIGLFLLAMAFFGLLQATIQHRRSLSRLKAAHPTLPYSISLVQSYFILAFTLSLLLVVLLRLS